MDFDSIIPLLFIIVFFVLPSIFKQIMARKKKTGEPKTIKKNPSLFERIIEQIRQFVQELEKQAQQQKKETREPETVWETLAEDDASQYDMETVEDGALPPDFETMEGDADFSAPSTMVSSKKRGAKKVSLSGKRIHPGKEDPCIKGRGRRFSGPGRFKSSPLQNAIVWSEILSKPVALREE